MSKRTPYRKKAVPQLPGADWPMVVHLLSARGFYRSTNEVASKACISPKSLYAVLEGGSPKTPVAAWLYNAARRRFCPADLTLASVSDVEPQWYSDYREAKRSAAA